MFQDAAQFLLRMACELAATAFWLRFYMQLTRVPFQNPFAQFVVKVTNFAVRPARRLIPGLFGLDLASLMFFLLAEFVWVVASHWLAGYPFLAAGAAVWPAFLLLTVAAAVKLVIYLLIALIFVQAIISWVNPFSPAAPVFYALARPVLAPFQRFIPPISGIDLSPLAAFVVLQLILIVPVAGLETFAHRLAFGLP
ncbi:YggT family protein [Parasulfuritortus cantonensis]|uniref:YggT family protein n=1 Tax=Parasulfuritortus cantonensis TaxID=2528202 RepID=A0A4R1BIS5_9PROT|nr:YggT family protein [Parasulfuritortus cantonensis]TCJ17200.1 YggT family protein [Parasulfuritortus cantonensis]